MPAFADPFGPYRGGSPFGIPGVDFFEISPDLGWDVWLGQYPQGREYSSPFYKQSQGLYSPYYKDFLSQSIMNPDLRWTDYLSKAPSLGGWWQGQSPKQRGEMTPPTAKYNLPK